MFNKLHEFSGSVKSIRHAQQFPIEAVEVPTVRPAQPDRTLYHGFKHRAEIKRRATDDLEHL